MNLMMVLPLFWRMVGDMKAEGNHRQIHDAPQKLLLLPSKLRVLGKLQRWGAGG